MSAAVSVEPTHARVSAALAAAALEHLPTLAEHACKGHGIGYFGEKIVGTTLPHLVEHIAIDLLVQQEAGSVAGNTTWEDLERESMRVRLLVPDKSPAAAKATQDALIDAVTLVNDLLERIGPQL
ncbi:MAG: hypothetical protein LBS98_01815 [Coriobacteriales bacterium]|jgi:hypothetical protein|nr:hypothetical protein [Coriobacteriales bacterium]